MIGKLTAAFPLAALAAAGPPPPPSRTAVPATQQTQQQVTAPPTKQETAAGGDYLIGPEDVLDVSVWNNTAISRTVPVRPDGRISLPLLNDLQAGGRTPLELRTTWTAS